MPLPGSWNKDFLQEHAREVTLAPWLQWTPTSGPGEHLQLKNRLGIINHWRNSTAHIQGPSSHQLASRILELREALQHESRAPVPQNHFSQAPMAHLVGDCADYVPAPGTPVSSPGPRPSSPASFSPGSSARFQQKQACQFKTFNQEGARFSIYCSCRLKVTQVNPQVSGCEDLVFCLCVSFFPG